MQYTKFRLTYYKDTGKYYTESTTQLDEPMEFYDILTMVQGWIRKQERLPGLIRHWAGPMVLEVIEADGTPGLSHFFMGK